MTTHPHRLEGPAVEVAGLMGGYIGTPVLHDCSFSLPAGAIAAVVGPNGAGKSTLLKLLTGALGPWHGTARIFSRPVAAARQAGWIAYMPQQEQLDWDYPLTVRDVVMTGRLAPIRRRGGWRGRLPMTFQPAEDRDAAARSLAAVGLADMARRPIGTLSGGQKKRALLARALAQEASLLLLDEPLAGVDRASEEVIRDILSAERERGRTIMMVTHDLEGMRDLADRVLLVQDGIVTNGAPEEVRDTAAPQSGYGPRMVALTGVCRA